MPTEEEWFVLTGELPSVEEIEEKTIGYALIDLDLYIEIVNLLDFEYGNKCYKISLPTSNFTTEARCELQQS